MKQLFLILLLYGTGAMSQNTAINIGVNTKNPGSRLTVNGSFAGDYKMVGDENRDIVLDDSNFYVAYRGYYGATFKLPKAISGPGNFKGRIYRIINNGIMQMGTIKITLEALGVEKIDAEGDVDYIVVPQGYYVELVSKGTTTGTTWELFKFMPHVGLGGYSEQFSKITIFKYEVPKNSSPQLKFTLSPPTVTDVAIPLGTGSIYLQQPTALFFHFSAGLSLINFFSPGDYYHFYRCELFINNTPTGIFQVVQEHSKSLQFNAYGTYYLPAGMHNVELRLSSWHDFGQPRNMTYGVLSLSLYGHM
ncbi:hypothetical protein [Flavobacterium sp. 38-13]|uniref:hypothetical protein n=1 Tax=Flavobacterium sp. 38-13 TaxID=1896168 RepID=UPI002579580C|nr:hypothetical protein [Flavobacterium sp. 38-13]